MTNIKFSKGPEWLPHQRDVLSRLNQQAKHPIVVNVGSVVGSSGNSTLGQFLRRKQQSLTGVKRLTTLQYLQAAGFGLCAQIADVVDSRFYQEDCDSGVSDDQFAASLAELIDSLEDFDLREKFPLWRHIPSGLVQNMAPNGHPHPSHFERVI